MTVNPVSHKKGNELPGFQIILTEVRKLHQRGDFQHCIIKSADEPETREQ